MLRIIWVVFNLECYTYTINILPIYIRYGGLQQKYDIDDDFAKERINDFEKKV